MKRLALLLLLAWPHLAAADSGMLMGGVANRQMPIDVLPTPTACYSERRLRTGYVANKGINVVRASDSATADIGFDAFGFPDKAAETAFCNATTCKLVTMYDQCGSNNLTQATDANRYTRSTGPSGNFNSSSATASTQTHVGASNITPATGVVSLTAVAQRSVSTNGCGWIRENAGANRLQATGSFVDGWSELGGTSGTVTSAATDTVWHSGVGVINGASSVLSIDGVETTGTATGNTVAGAPAFLGAASTTCKQVEAVVWDNVALTAAQRNYIISSQRRSWGF
jgi:hypothetical protein